MAICVCQLMIVEVTAYSHIGEFTQSTFFSFLFSFCWSIFFFFSHSFVHIYSYSFASNVIHGQLFIVCLSYLYFLESDIERLKRRVESLVKSNDEKVIIYYNYPTVYFTYHTYLFQERKIEDLQCQITRYHSITVSSVPPTNGTPALTSSSTNTTKVENSGIYMSC
jgi:hypothetical protein